MRTTVIAVLSVIAILLIGAYQYETAKEEMRYTDSDKVMVIIKRVAIFIFVSVVAFLLILYASGGGSSTPDWLPERRWELGRG